MRAYYSNNRAEFLETTTESQIHKCSLRSLRGWVCQWRLPGRSCFLCWPWRRQRPSRRPRLAASWRRRRGAENLDWTWKTRHCPGNHNCYLILSRLVGLPSLISPPDTHQESGPPTGLKIVILIKILFIFGGQIPWWGVTLAEVQQGPWLPV